MLNKLLKTFLFITLIYITSNAESADYVKLTQINTDDGLSQNSINHIIQDNDGFLWIATQQGLNRYDGYRLSTIHSPDSILENNSIEFLWEDSKGLIWISTDTNKSFILNKNENTLTPVHLKALNSTLNNPFIYNAIEDQDNNVWISTYEEIFFYNRKSNDFSLKLSMKEIFNDPTGEIFIRDLLLVKTNLLIATSSGLYSFNIHNKKLQKIQHLNNDDENVDNNNVKSLFLNAKQNILVGTVEGLYEVDSQYVNSISKNIISKIIVSDLNIWKIIEKPTHYLLATNEGLFKLDFLNQLSQVFKYSDMPFDTSDDDIVTMIEDREGVLWFGSRGDGIFKWHPNQAVKQHFWSKSNIEQKLSNDMILDIHQDKENFIWIATENGLNKIGENGKVISRLFVNKDEKAVISKSTIFSIAENNSQLWLNTFDGIKVLNKKTGKILKKIFPENENNIFDQQVLQLFFTSPNELLIVSFDAVYRYNLLENRVSVIESTKDKDNGAEWTGMFFSSTVDDRDILYMAGSNKLNIFSKTTGMLSTFHSIESIDNVNSFPSNIYRDGNNIWVTYSGVGLFVLDEKTGAQEHFISEKEMSANTLMDIFPDDNGNVWVTSNDGLFKINKVNYSFQKFDRNDGFITSEFNSDTTQRLQSGEILVGSIKGAFLFDPNNLNNRSIIPISPKITNISQLSSNITPRYSDFNNASIVMNHDDFGLTINFSALLLDKPEQVKYTYSMEGASNLSKTFVNRSELFFPSFSAGKRTLLISARDYRNGEESAPIKIIIITKPSPLLSPMAKLIYLFVIILVGTITYRLYIKRQLDKERAFQEIKQSEERLNLALKGGNSGLWDWYAKNNQVYEPRLADLDKENNNGFIPFRSRISAIFKEDQNNVLRKWHDFRHGKIDVFDCVYRMQNKNKKWEWFRDIAMVSEFDSDNKPVRVTGTYTNIDEKQKASEQIRLFSKAFENTLDIIIILDNKKKIIATNNAFKDITQYSQNEVLGIDISILLSSNDDDEIYPEIFSSIENYKHWKGESNLIGKHGIKIPTLVNATIFSSSNTTQYYVFAISDISKQKQAESNLKKLVNFDPLTELPNRALLLDRISHAIPISKRYKKQLAIFFIDLDRFKVVNDSLGHDVGDKVLVRVAKTLQRCCRADDTVARLGGDEFVVMLEDVESISAINRILQNILSEIKRPFLIDDNQVSISASIGISIYPQDADEPKKLLKRADIAMYHAKNTGRNNFSYFKEHMNKQAEKRLSLETKLRLAVENNELYLVYQPQFDLESGQICGVEALARWTTKSGINIPPSTFIPIAEELGLIIPITEYLLPLALKQIALWNHSNQKIMLAFNLSTIHIYDKNFVNFVNSQISHYPDSKGLLEFELTESTLMKDVNKAINVFKQLETLEIELALDDFGTGYSSLKYLTSLPIHKLKIDMSFVQKIGESPENDVIIHAIITLAKALNLSVVAEGIETEEQFDFLKKEKIDFAQGFLFSKPLEVAEITKILNKNIYD